MTRDFRFHDALLRALPSGALHWPAQGWLLVADLHLGKSERQARRGGALLPPYDTAATLTRLEADLAHTGAAHLFLLGDSFDDDAAATGLEKADRDRLAAICDRVQVVALSGNHDPAPALPKAKAAPDWAAGAIMLRHVAGEGPDISGHYHPALRLRSGRVRAFLVGRAHLILPAYGTYTGGLEAGADPLRALVPQGYAIACTPALPLVPLPVQRDVSTVKKASIAASRRS